MAAARCAAAAVAARAASRAAAVATETQTSAPGAAIIPAAELTLAPGLRRHDLSWWRHQLGATSKTACLRPRVISWNESSQKNRDSVKIGLC